MRQLSFGCHIRHKRSYRVCCHGHQARKIKRSGLEEYGWGYGKDLERGDNERIFQHLLDAGAFKERSKVNKVGFATNYLHVRIYDPDYGHILTAAACFDTQ